MDKKMRLHIILLFILLIFTAGCGATVENSDDATGENLFEKFLANEEPVIFDLDNFSDYVPYVFDYDKENKREYLLSEIIHRVKSEDEYGSSVEIKYAYIFPQEKEAEQLLVSIITGVNTAVSYNHKFVIGNVDGKLWLLYECVDHFREEVYINKFGYIHECTYPGYCPPSNVYKIITEDGCKLIYGETYDCGSLLTPLKMNQDGEKKEVNLESFNEEDGCVWEYWFEDGELCSYSFVNENGEPDYIGHEEKLYGKNSPYRKAFEDAGIKFYEMSEIKDMISKREEELGITDNIKDAGEPEWIEIKDISG